MANIRNPVKYFFAKVMFKLDESFLLRQGVRVARERGLELNLGCQEILTPPDKKGRIYLPPVENGVDVSQLIALVADVYPDRTRRYLHNKRILNA